ncbi:MULTISPECIES: hypothetical protein [unclassified Empedobacter]|uniref:hypothetical protein n=1 Tax=unclassified Empedobacter TaxID=2643773 RepID=UPI0025B91557|nr:MULTISPECIES: hypothetical protein [unclassified Empedobacter]
MKATNQQNKEIADSIGEELNIKFQHTELSLNGWGDVDDYAIIDDNNWVLLECENTQKHPNTNVLKLYPFLEENPELNIILLHVFFSNNKAPKNRVKLCDFLADKMQKEFGKRFQYKRIMQ